MTDKFTEQLKTENRNLLESNKSLSFANSQISDAINSGKLEIESLVNFKKEVELGIQILRTKNEEMNSLAISLDSELVEKNAKLKELNENILKSESRAFEANKFAEQEIARFKEDHNKTMTSYLDEVESKKREIARLDSRTIELRSNIVGIELELETAKQKNIEGVAELEKTIHAKNLAIKALDKENQALEDKIVKNSKIFAEIGQLKSLSITLTNSKINLETEISTLEKEISILAPQKEEIQKAIEILKENKKLSEEEYELSKQKIFGIADRERQLSEKEEFVKAKFEQAGLIYE